MEESIISAVITGIISLTGMIFSNIQSNKKIESKIETTQAVTECKLEELTREVRKNSNLVDDIPVIKEQIKNINYRLDSFEGKE